MKKYTVYLRALFIATLIGLWGTSVLPAKPGLPGGIEAGFLVTYGTVLWQDGVLNPYYTYTTGFSASVLTTIPVNPGVSLKTGLEWNRFDFNFDARSSMTDETGTVTGSIRTNTTGENSIYQLQVPVVLLFHPDVFRERVYFLAGPVLAVKTGYRNGRMISKMVPDNPSEEPTIFSESFLLPEQTDRYQTGIVLGAGTSIPVLSVPIKLEVRYTRDITPLRNTGLWAYRQVFGIRLAVVIR